MTLYRAILLLTLIGSAGCGGDQQLGRTLRSDSAGVEIVRYEGPDRSLPWTTTERFRLGGSETRSEESFFEVRTEDIAVDSAGQLYILNRANTNISVFDSDGQHLRSLGGSGTGPGELGYPEGLVLLSENRIGALDMSRFQIVSFDSAGTPLALLPLPTSYRGGSIVASGDTLTILTQLSPETQSGLSYGVVRATPRDTTVIVFLPPNESQPVQLASCRMMVEHATPVLTPLLRWSGSVDRVALVTGASYDIVAVDRDGQMLKVRRSLEAVPATRENALETLSETSLVRSMNCDATEIVEKFGVAPVLSIIDGLAVAPDRSLWVRRRASATETGPIDVFDPTGEYVGTLEPGFPFPAAFYPDGRLIVRETDELGVTRVVVYQIVKGSGAFGV